MDPKPYESPKVEAALPANNIRALTGRIITVLGLALVMLMLRLCYESDSLREETKNRIIVFSILGVVVAIGGCWIVHNRRVAAMVGVLVIVLIVPMIFALLSR